MISSAEELTELLTRCGYASEPASWSDTARHMFKQLQQPLARQLSGDQYKQLLVALKGEKLQIYQGFILACELQGEFSDEQLIEQIELAAKPDRAPRDPATCICLDLPLPANHYEKEKFIGIDETEGRFGQVNIHRCRHCGRQWLHYFVEYPAYERSGRYFMGLLTPEIAATITAEGAVGYLESLDWHLYGGSYFEGKGKSKIPRIPTD